MARQCGVCGKRAQIGNRVTTRGKQKYLGGVGTKVTGISRRTSRPQTAAISRCSSARSVSAAVASQRLCARLRSRFRTTRPRRRPRSSVFAMSISRQDIEKVALLARLQGTEDELSKMKAELAQIVGYVDQLGEVDTNGIEPMAHAI